MDAFDALLDLALEEDLGKLGDITSSAVFGTEQTVAILKSKDTGLLCGTEYFARVFNRIDPAVDVDYILHEGDPLFPGQEVAVIKGRTLSILMAERIGINFISFLSGIATMTGAYARAAMEGGKTLILDTRKTLPGYRALSKYAVTVGGGKNHRMGLYDMVLLKDNHIDACGSIKEAVERVRKAHGSEFKIEVECRTAEHVKEALASKVEWIMLDNMDYEKTLECVKLIGSRALVELSGNFDLEKVREFSGAGADYISVGKLTHSVKAFDFSLVIQKGIQSGSEV